MAKQKVNISLGEIATSHAVFEQDQVLTAGQLNSVADYLGDQQRLGRVMLLGAGIAGGLRIARAGNAIRVEKGVGVTTDGDLMLLDADALFESFKPYGEAAPEYAALLDDAGKPRSAFELLPKGAGQGLDKLPSPGLGGMAVVMLMESYVADHDLCSGTHCDNLGGTALNATRFLLLPQSDAEAMAKSLPQPPMAAKDFPRLQIRRVLPKGALGNTGALAESYQRACNEEAKGMKDHLASLHKLAPWLTTGLFNGDPASEWQKLLDEKMAKFDSNSSGIQYGYGFLKDLAETWNAMRDALLDDDSQMHAGPAAFPKHLLLGAVANPSTLRSGFYPSRLTSSGRQHLERARFLAWKLHVLFNSFDHPSNLLAPAVAVIPSRAETASLEDRAIPYYYAAGGKWNVLHAWNWRLEKRGDSSLVAGYRAREMGAAVDPETLLQYQLGAYDFFRIEGHLGMKVEEAKAALEKKVDDNNLPFAVRALLLHNDRKKIRIKPPFRFGDLHRFHHLLRSDVASHIKDNLTFADRLKGHFNEAIKNKDIPDRLPDKESGMDVLKMAENTHQKISEASEAALGKEGRGGALGARSYADYHKAGMAWKGKLGDAMEETIRNRSNLGPIIRMDAGSPMDAIGASKHHAWLDWLDDLIAARDEHEDEKLLLANFYGFHPQLEHLGGVPRGGTFVLVYDDNGKVVADLALPYWCDDLDEKVKEEPAQPELVLPDLRIPMDIHPIKVRPPMDWVLDDFKKNKIKPELDGISKEVADPKKTFDMFNSSIDTINKVFAMRGVEIPSVTGATPKETGDVKLDRGMREVAHWKEEVEILSKEAVKPDIKGPERELIEKQLDDAQANLAKGIKETTQHIIENQVDVSSGAPAAAAVTLLAGSLVSVSGEARTKLGNELTGMNSGEKVAGTIQGAMLNNMLKLGGFKAGG